MKEAAASFGAPPPMLVMAVLGLLCGAAAGVATCFLFGLT